MADNPYTSVSVSGFNASAPANDGSRVSTNRLDWDFHIDKIGTPLKNAIESMDTNISSAFGALIVTDDPGQEGMIVAMREFVGRDDLGMNTRREFRNLRAEILEPENENFVVGAAFFAG